MENSKKLPRSRAQALPDGMRPDSSAKRRAVPWFDWQYLLYLLILGWICLVLAPLTNLWWFALVFGAAVPVMIAALGRSGSNLKDERKSKEQELLRALAARDELTPAMAAMQTSLTVDEAATMLEDLARKCHLTPRAEGGVIAYALRERRDAPDEVSPSCPKPESPSPAQKRLDDPLSEREIEVLNLLASGRTNSEVARDLFISVGTVKSHTGNIYRKLDVRNRAEALARARELRVLP